MLLETHPILIYETKTVFPNLVHQSIFNYYESYDSFSRDLRALYLSYSWKCDSCKLCIAGKSSIEFAIDYLILLHTKIALPGEMYHINPDKAYTILHDVFVFGQRMQILLTPVEAAIYKPLLLLCESFKPLGKTKLKIA